MIQNQRSCHETESIVFSIIRCEDLSTNYNYKLEQHNLSFRITRQFLFVQKDIAGTAKFGVWKNYTRARLERNTANENKKDRPTK